MHAGFAKRMTNLFADNTIPNDEPSFLRSIVADKTASPGPNSVDDSRDDRRLDYLAACGIAVLGAVFVNQKPHATVPDMRERSFPPLANHVVKARLVAWIHIYCLLRSDHNAFEHGGG